MSEVKDNIRAGLGRGLGGKVLGKRAGGGGNVRFEINVAAQLITPN